MKEYRQQTIHVEHNARPPISPIYSAPRPPPPYCSDSIAHTTCAWPAVSPSLACEFPHRPGSACPATSFGPQAASLPCCVAVIPAKYDVVFTTAHATVLKPCTCFAMPQEAMRARPCCAKACSPHACCECNYVSCSICYRMPCAHAPAVLLNCPLRVRSAAMHCSYCLSMRRVC
jgi:hypothetical protein